VTLLCTVLKHGNVIIAIFLIRFSAQCIRLKLKIFKVFRSSHNVLRLLTNAPDKPGTHFNDFSQINSQEDKI